MPDNLTPAKVAKRLAISANTVRRLTTAFADWLSDSATPPADGRRLYSEEDLAVLELIVNMRNRGASDVDIIQRLEAGVPLPRNLPTFANTLDTLPTPPAAHDVEPLISALQGQAAAQNELITILASVHEEETKARREQTATLERLASALEGETAAKDRLINAAHLVFVGILAVCIIVLLTLAVAVGWLG
jgi:DNA-binding transcriptional MerR regulator